MNMLQKIRERTSTICISEPSTRFQVKSINARTSGLLATNKEDKSGPGEIQNFDRISDLNDSILHHIFSFLPTEHVVKTSILSKRWHKLWKSLPYLYFQESGVINNERFINFIDKFMLYRDESSIIKFQLSCQMPCDDSHFNEWIRSAVRARVREIDLYIRFAEIRSLRSLSTCNSLVTLKLDFGILVRFPKTFCFPMLKRLHLRRVLISENFAHQLMKSPNLETISLILCESGFNSSPNSLSIEDLIIDDHSSMILPHLDHLSVGMNFYGPSERDSSFFLSKFIRKLYNVKFLELCYHCIMLLQSKRLLLDHLPTFCNLLHLELTVGFQYNDIPVMSSLLQCCPVLDSLEIRFLIYRLDLWLCEREVIQKQLPSLFVPPSLKQIRMKNFKGTKSQVELVRFFLENAQGLEKIIFQPADHVKNPHNLLPKELAQLPRLSTNCTLEYRITNKNYSLP